MKMYKKLVCGIMVVVLLLSISMYGDSAVLPKLIHKNDIDTKDKNIVLIIRDGPTYLTPEYISVLKEHKVKNVVFCLVGKQITEKTGKNITLIEKNGHIVCNQGFLHRRYSEFKNFSEARKDMKKVLYEIKKHAGIKSQIAWAPYADLSLNFLRSVKSLEIPYIILPNTHTRDWEQPAVLTVKHITTQVKPMDIILLHETKETLKALPAILENLTKRGYKIISPFEYYIITNLKPIDNELAGK